MVARIQGERPARYLPIECRIHGADDDGAGKGIEALQGGLWTAQDFYPRNIHIHGFQITDLMEHGWDPRPDLSSLLAAVAEKRFTVTVDSTFPLSEAPQAHRRLSSRAVMGKVILTS